MLSRLLSARSSSVGRSLLQQTRVAVAAPALTRSFRMTPFLSQSTAPLAAKAELDPADIVQKYGSTTFWGMVAAILVSKEMFILDAEFLLSIEVVAFVMAGYVMAGDTVNKMSEEMDQKTVEQFNGANDFMIEMLNQYKMVQATTQNKPAVMREYAAEFKTAIEVHAAFQTVSPQHEARKQVLDALEKFKSKEEHAAAMAWQTAVDAAVANVTQAFQTDDAKLNDQMLDLAVANMGFAAKETDEKADPVKRLFMKQFE